MEKTRAKIEHGGIYFFPAWYHKDHMQVVDQYQERDVVNSTAEKTIFYAAVKVIYLTGVNAGDYVILPEKLLEENAEPVPAEQLERYFDTTAGRERAVVISDTFELETVSGNYIELDNGLWLRSLKDGRYVDDHTKCLYVETYYRTDETDPEDRTISFTGRYIRLFMTRG